MTHLFAILFFSGILGTAIAALWSTFEEYRPLVLAHLPWRVAPREGPPVVIHSVRRDGLTCPA